MRFRLRIPRFGSSAVESGRQASKAVLDGRDVVAANVWQLPPHTTWVAGRPAVWITLALQTPNRLFGRAVPSAGFHFEEDFGGHLFVIVVGENQTNIIEAGPTEDNGTGGLVPYRYPEEDFAQRHVVDFEPVRALAPLGLTEIEFAELVLGAQRAYDGNQFYLVIEMPFLRIGRDSNSYAVGVLLASGVDTRAIPRVLPNTLRHEIAGYPGAEDPVHLANFGVYPGAPAPLTADCAMLAYHDESGEVRYVVIGGPAFGSARLPDGEHVSLDAQGRCVLSVATAGRHGLPLPWVDPPAHIRDRTRFPKRPAPAGAEVTLVVDGQPVPLRAGEHYRGTIVERNDALGFAVLRSDARDVVLPLSELGVELRDPIRVDRLFRVGNELTVGLHRDRHPMLVPYGPQAVDDALIWHRFHAPSWTKVAITSSLGVAVLAAGVLTYQRSR